jgi:hypothetical protein
MATVFMYQALSRSSRTLNVWDMTLHDYSSEYHCFDLLWLGLTKWKETLKVVSWLPPISCYCADLSQLSPALSFTKWGGLLLSFMVWNSPSITECISYFQKMFILCKNFYACYAFFRIFYFYYVYFKSSWNQTDITLKMVSDVHCGSISPCSSWTVTRDILIGLKLLVSGLNTVRF